MCSDAKLAGEALKGVTVGLPHEWAAAATVVGARAPAAAAGVCVYVCV